MKLHQINKNSEIFVAKLPESINMTNICNNDNILKLKFKRIITSEDKRYFAEWCMERPKANGKLDCVNASPFDFIGDLLVFNKNNKNDMYVAIVHDRDMKYYINYN